MEGANRGLGPFVTGRRGYVAVKAKAGWSLSIIWALALGAGIVLGADVPDRKNDAFLRLRGKMVRSQISHPPDYRKPVREKRVLAAMRAVPRHLFVLSKDIDKAYGDYPLPIGYGQTISQPYIVALMTKALELKGGEKVLEIGTGSGYAAAILGEIAGEVFTIERHKALADEAKEKLKAWRNVHVIHGDGTKGLKSEAPFDAIVATAAGPKVPETLKNQLKIGGRLVIPVGQHARFQTLLQVTRKSQDEFTEKDLGSVAFVPLIGEEGF